MNVPAVIGECKGCCWCMMACPMGAVGPYSPKTVDESKCIACGKCVTVCPNKCRAMQETNASN